MNRQIRIELDTNFYEIRQERVKVITLQQSIYHKKRGFTVYFYLILFLIVIMQFTVAVNYNKLI